MTANILHFPAPELRECPDCERETACRSVQARAFEYGVGKDHVALQADVPVWTCTTCGYAFGDGEGEDAEHEAVCRHFGLLTPREIVELRAQLGLTQIALAALTGLGEASIKRWEAGTVLQNQAADNLLRLCADQVSRLALQRIARERLVEKEVRI